MPWWREWTYCNGLMTADNTTWYKVIHKYMEKPDYTHLKSLACSECLAIRAIGAMREYSELPSQRYDKKLKHNVRIYIFHSIVARHAKNDTILDYILANFDEVKPRYKYIFSYRYVVCILIKMRYVYQS